MLKHLLSSPAVAILLLIALAVSLLGNYALFKKALDFYTRETLVRLSPVDTRFARDNQRLLAETKARPRVVIFGESRCAMWEPHPPNDWGDVDIVNRGIGGESTAQILARLEADVLGISPDLVILQMGDNDLKAIGVLPERRDRVIAQTEANIETIARTIAERGIPVLLTTIFPTGRIELARRPLWSPEVNDAIDAVNQRLLNLDHEGILPVDCDPILRSGRYIKTEYALDTLHLTPAGYQALNEALAPKVRDLLGDESP